MEGAQGLTGADVSRTHPMVQMFPLQLIAHCLRHALVVAAMVFMTFSGVCIPGLDDHCSGRTHTDPTHEELSFGFGNGDDAEHGEHDEGNCPTCDCTCHETADLPAPVVVSMAVESEFRFLFPLFSGIADSPVPDIDLPPVIA